MIYNNVGEGASSGGYRPATFVIGTTTSGHTEKDCDYLCDGDADDVEIQAAIDALPSNGGKILILDGTYSILNPIKTSEPLISICGNGMSTILEPQDNTRPIQIFWIAGRSIRISDLYIDLSSITSPVRWTDVYHSNNVVGVYINEASNGRYYDIDNVTFSMPYYDPDVVTALDNSKSAAIYSYYDISHLKIINCKFNYGNYGIYFNSNVEYSSIEGCFFTSADNVYSFNNDGQAIHGSFSSGSIRDCTFTEETDHLSSFIEISGSGSSIVGNIFDGFSNENCISISGKYGLIKNNYFYCRIPYDSDTADDYKIIVLDSTRALDFNVISGNVFRLPSMPSGRSSYNVYGIFIISSSEYDYLRCGIITGNGFDGAGFGIYGIFYDCSINSNTFRFNTGITLKNGSKNTIVNGNTGGGTPIDESSNSTNIITDNHS